MIHIVLLTWNQSDDVIAQLRRLSPTPSEDLSFWVVDNASKASERQKLTEWRSEVRLLQNAQNLGYGGGINRALEEILKQASPDDMVALINNDVVIKPDQIRQLAHRLASTAAAGVIGPVLIEGNDRNERYSLGGRDISLYMGTRVTQQASVSLSQGLLHVDYVPGTVLVMRCATLTMTGLLDTNYFFSGEIADWCWMARYMGWRSVIDPSLQIRHLAADNEQRRSTLYRYYTLRNRFYFIRKHKPRQTVWLLPYWALIGMAMATLLLCKGQRAEAASTLNALRDGLNGQVGPVND